jgi:hypothetical protein
MAMMSQAHVARLPASTAPVAESSVPRLAGGSLRASTRPISDKHRTDMYVCVSIHPEGKLCGLFRSQSSACFPYS